MERDIDTVVNEIKLNTEQIKQVVGGLELTNYNDNKTLFYLMNIAGYLLIEGRKLVQEAYPLVDKINDLPHICFVTHSLDENGKAVHALTTQFIKIRSGR